MNAATMRSPRLQRVLRLLSANPGEWYTTRQIIKFANVCAVNSVIAELRHNGVVIETGTIKRGGRCIWRYRLAGGGENADTQP